MEKTAYFSGSDFLISIIKGKWKEFIIAALGIKSRHYNELLRLGEQVFDRKPITKKVLTEELNELISYNIIKKTVFNTNPITVKYSLTKSGIELQKLLFLLSQKGNQFFEAYLYENKDTNLKLSYPSQIFNVSSDDELIKISLEYRNS